MKNILFPLIFSLSAFHIKAQEGKLIDSLKNILTTNISDSLSFQLQCELVDAYAVFNFDSAKHFANKALSFSRKNNDEKDEAWAFSRLGLAYDYHGDLDSALMWYQKSLDQFTTLKDTSRMADLYLNIGVCFHYSTMYDSALTNYMKAIELKELVNSKKNLGYAFNNVGMILRSQEAYDKAIEYYKLSLKIKRDGDDELGIITTLGNMAASYQAMKKYDTAELHIKKALVIAQNIENKNSEGWAYVSLGQNYFYKGEYEMSLKYELKAQKILLIKGDQRSKLHNHSSLARTYVKLRSYEKGEVNFLLAEKIALELNMTEALSKTYDGLSELYQQIGKFEKSLIYYKKYDSISNELFNESKTAIIEELDEKYQSVKKERKITELELYQKTADLAIVSSQNQRNIFMLITFTVIMIAVLLYLLVRSKSKRNTVIFTSLQEKETLLKEIHHRVKNNLQVISSLLNLQAGSIDNEAASSAVKEGQHRVKSMALIHQKLYSTDDVRGVDIQDYLETLTSQLFQAFGLKSDKVVYKVDAAGLILDIDTVIPLGLIINELITNSIKHAFEGAEKGELQIQLKEIGDQLSVVVKDNGTGMNKEEMEKVNSFGWKIIQSLSRKLKAEINIFSDSGTTVELTLSRYKLVV